MDSILRLLIRCLSYQSPQIGSFLNVHMRADVTKVPFSLPSSPDHFAAVRSRAVQQPPALAAGDARLRVAAEQQRAGLRAAASPGAAVQRGGERGDGVHAVPAVHRADHPAAVERSAMLPDRDRYEERAGSHPAVRADTDFLLLQTHRRRVRRHSGDQIPPVAHAPARLHAAGPQGARREAAATHAARAERPLLVRPHHRHAAASPGRGGAVGRSAVVASQRFRTSG